MKLDLPKEPEAVAPPPPPSPDEQKRAALSKEDRKLLDAFGGQSLSLGGDGTPGKPRGPHVSFNIQRKGKGGKTVTLVYGLQELELAEQMSMCSQIQKGLGTGARFEDGILQIQGDQRERAKEWFAKRGFRC
ncbi:MAG: translation initiation factor [Victivallales bacterium]|nr:translation initiation factor [Victivallales bacterium]